jgi:hypothetical protein
MEAPGGLYVCGGKGLSSHKRHKEHEGINLCVLCVFVGDYNCEIGLTLILVDSNGLSQLV